MGCRQARCRVAGACAVIVAAVKPVLLHCFLLSGVGLGGACSRLRHRFRVLRVSFGGECPEAGICCGRVGECLGWVRNAAGAAQHGLLYTAAVFPVCCCCQQRQPQQQQRQCVVQDSCNADRVCLGSFEFVSQRRLALGTLSSPTVLDTLPTPSHIAPQCTVCSGIHAGKPLCLRC